jgi:hypothetical protein
MAKVEHPTVDSPTQREREYHPKDIFSVPNAISATGLGLVLYGARKFDTGKHTHDAHAVRTAIMMMAGGRLLDLLDGKAARCLHQESDLGAAVDAVGDKCGMLAIGTAMARHNIIPKPVVGMIAAKNTVNAAATAYYGLGHTEAIRTPKAGKLSMAADNVAVAAYMAEKCARKGSKMERVAHTVAVGSVALGAILGIAAAKDYLTGNYAKAKDYSKSTKSASAANTPPPPRQPRTRMRRKRRMRG